MRILVLIHEYPPVGGGGGRVAQDLCEGLAAHGHTLEVLTATCGDGTGVETRAGLTIRRLRSLRREPFRADMRAMAGYVAAAAWEGLKAVKRFKPDVIHAHFAVPAGAAAWLISRLTGVPYVLTAHLGDVPGGVPEKTGKWFRYIFPFTPPIWNGARAVVAVSEFTRGLAVAKYTAAVRVIPNGVDLKTNDPGEIRVNDPPRVIFAGRFMPQKDPLQVVRALAEVKALRWNAVMCGDGPLRPDVEAEIARLGLGDRIILTGWVPPEAVLGWYRQGDLLFMPSLSEGLPVVGVQAMAYGLALVLSRAGGNPELVEEGENGFLFNPGDGKGFANGLRALLSDPRRLLAARQSSRRLAERFDLAKIVGDYERLLGGER